MTNGSPRYTRRSRHDGDATRAQGLCLGGGDTQAQAFVETSSTSPDRAQVTTERFHAPAVQTQSLLEQHRETLTVNEFPLFGVVQPIKNFFDE
jgi:hypothetical protein